MQVLQGGLKCSWKIELEDNAEASAVADCVKLLPTTLASHTGAPVTLLQSSTPKYYMSFISLFTHTCISQSMHRKRALDVENQTENNGQILVLVGTYWGKG